MNPPEKERAGMNEEQAWPVLDVTKEVCPMTFVRTRLHLDRMSPGQGLEVRFLGREPGENIPRSARELGHEVLEVVFPEGAAPGRIRLRKRGPA
ncbi:MAG: sulfurtransferase TusA family protein [Roseococcus sp.]